MKTKLPPEKPARKAAAFSAVVLSLALSLPFAAPARAAEDADPFAPGASLIAADQAAASGGREAWAADMPTVDISWLDLHGAHLTGYGGQMSGDGVFGLSLGMTDRDGNYDSFYLAVDGRGTVLFRADYDIANTFSDGFMIAGRYIEDDRVWQPGELRAPPGSLNTYVDKTGRELIPPGSYAHMEDFHEGMAAVAVDTSTASAAGELLWGYLDATGTLAIPPRFKGASYFREGLAPVQDADGKWGFIDRAGQLIIPCAYDLALPFSEGLAYVQVAGRVGYIDKENQIAIPITLAADENVDANRDPSFYGGRAVACVNTEFRYYTGDGAEWTAYRLYGYIDTTGAFVIEPNLFSAQPFHREHALVSYANAAFTIQPSALIDRDGNRITPFWSYGFYERPGRGKTDLYLASDFASNEFSICVLNGNGAEIVPLRFYNISQFNDDGIALAVAEAATDGNIQRVALLRAKPESALPQAGRLIKIEIDGERLSLPDVDPVIENDRTLVPMRYIFEALGAEPLWNEAERSVTAEKDGAEIKLRIGESVAWVNGEEIPLDAAPVLRGGRTLVPVRFIAESLGARVDWDAARRTVVITARDTEE
ncbi:MAG: WG repeat-containing protein [Clostridiales Family XIII bacterium]|jgi:hypothetical protein|nr:WG repeat-containing protein [Clostridiales Family XIII bacterium]